MEHSRKNVFYIRGLAVIDASEKELLGLDYDTDSSEEQLGRHIDELMATTPDDPVPSTSSDGEIVVANDDGPDMIHEQ